MCKCVCVCVCVWVEGLNLKAHHLLTFLIAQITRTIIIINHEPKLILFEGPWTNKQHLELMLEAYQYKTWQSLC